jgi:hypothetical protein
VSWTEKRRDGGAGWNWLLLRRQAVRFKFAEGRCVAISEEGLAKRRMAEEYSSVFPKAFVNRDLETYLWWRGQIEAKRSTSREEAISII